MVRNIAFHLFLEYVTTRVQVNQNGLKLIESHQPLVYANHVNIMRGSVHTVKEMTEALAITSQKTGLELNADKTKYIVKSRDPNAGRNHNIKTDYYFL